MTSHAVPEPWRLAPDFVPRGRYVDREFLALEHERLFTRVWQMACREEEVPAVGSFLEYAIGDQSFLIVRVAPDEIRAFYNACIHRGVRLGRGSGRVKEFRCPFHGWRYALDGRCTFVFREEEFAPRPGGEKRLHEVHCERWGGWVFINPDPQASPLREWLEPVAERVAPWRLEEMRYLWHKRTILPANWKTALDAFIEGYHTPGTHPQYSRFAEGPAPSTRPLDVSEFASGLRTPSIAYRNHSRFVFGVSEAGDVGRPALPPAQALANNVIYHVAQLRSLNTAHDERAARELLELELAPGTNPYPEFMRLRRKHAEAAGVRWVELSPAQLEAGQGDWHVFPTLVILLDASCALGYRALPNGMDPDSCIFDVWSIERFPDGQAPKVELQFFERWEDGDFGGVLEQDFRNMSEVTAGLHQRGFPGHWLNPRQESAVFNAHRIADRFLFGLDAGSGGA